MNGRTSRPAISWYDVYTAARTVDAAKKRVVVRPYPRTLVQFDTCFYTSGAPWTVTGMRLLGQRLDLRGEPTSYLWRFGDGATLRTATAGTPPPDPTVIHKYLYIARSLPVSVTTSYRVTYRVNGGAWQTLPRQLVATGPATPLRVQELVPTLVDPTR